MFVEFTESVNLSKVNFSRYKLYLNELENKINYITHIITVLVYDSWSTNVISSPHPVFCCFPRRPLAILGILFVGNQKHLAHISNLIEHWSHHLVCVHVHAPPGLWAPRMEKTVPHLLPFPWHLAHEWAHVWMKVNLDRICFREDYSSLLYA